MAKDVKLPVFEDTSGVESWKNKKIFQVLWYVDPARLKNLKEGQRIELVKTAFAHEKTEANLNIEFNKNVLKTLDGVEKILGLR